MIFTTRKTVNAQMLLKKYAALLAVGMLVSFSSCSNRDPADLHGSWRLDSIYNFYNGFGHTNLDVDHFPLLHYQPDGQLRMTKGQESRYFLYEVHPPDTVTHKTPDGMIMERSIIVSVHSTHLVLKKELSPVFQGKNQHRYEIKYFSRVNE